MRAIKNNTAYMLIATLCLLVFYQYSLISTIKTENNELTTKLETLEQTQNTYQEIIEQQSNEIAQLVQAIVELERNQDLPPEIATIIEPPIPKEWVNQSKLLPINLTNFTLSDPYNKIQVTNEKLSWNDVNRTQNQGLVGTGFNLTHHIIEFDFQLSNFTFGTGGNRRIITLWAISNTNEVKDTRSYTMLYAEQVSYQKGIYELIFHQKKNGESIWVDVGNVYDLNSTYHCRIIRYGNYSKYQIYNDSSKNVLLDESLNYELVEDDYQFLYLGYMYPPSKPNDLHIMSSGSISNVRMIAHTSDQLIPGWWIQSTETYQVDLSPFVEMDPDNSIDVTSQNITWSQMDKTLERRVYTELSEKQKTELVSEFCFQIDAFTNNDRINSRIVSLWMLGETVDLGVMGNRSFTQLYAEHVSGSVSQYKMVLHQRVAGPNQFISLGPVLNASQRYYVRVFVYDNKIKYHISESEVFDEPFFESSESIMVPRDYRYLMFSCMFINPEDRGIWSSGSISDITMSR